MTIASLSRRMAAKVAAGLAAVATLATMSVALAPTAAADPAAGCYWDGAGHGVQRCDVFSEAMNRTIAVQVRPAGSRALYLLDGQRASEDFNAWAQPDLGNAPANEALGGFTLVMPVGGASTFYSDWSSSTAYSFGAGAAGSSFDNPTSSLENASLIGNPIMWETFLTTELPDFLADRFGTQRTGNSIAGLSMGGTAAFNIAGRNHGMFTSAASFSGYLDTQAPGIPLGITYGMLNVSGYSSASMWGSSMGSKWTEHNPAANLGNYSGVSMYISAANGQPFEGEAYHAEGSMLEDVARSNSQSFAADAKAAGLGGHITESYDKTGMHNWNTWRRDLADAAGWIASH